MNTMDVKTASSARRATLKDVARDLGVVPSTVSNAYNRPELVSAELRERVFEAASRLGYTGPDPMARGLRRGTANAIGIIHPEPVSYAFTDPVASLFLRGLATAVEVSGHGLLLVSRSRTPSQELAAVRNAAVDGFVVHCLRDEDPLLQAVLQRRLPTVFIDRPGVDGLPSVGIDHEAGAQSAAQHLIELGHRRFGVVAFGLTREPVAGIADRVRQESATHGVARARLRGYAAALSAAGLTWHDHAVVCECAGNSPAAGRSAAATLLDQALRPTAILAMSDQLAFGVLLYAEEIGVSVPEQLSVIGFDDVPAAARSVPALTTIHQPHVGKGRCAGQLLLPWLKYDVQPQSSTLPTRLVVRESTAHASPEVGTAPRARRHA